VKRKFLTAVSATALSLALLAGAPAGAQGLDDATASGLAALGITGPVEALDTETVAQIKNVLSSTDDDSLKRQRIEQLLGTETATATDRLGVGQLQDSVSADLASIGMDASGVEMLTLDQLAQIEGVMSSDDDTDIKRARVEEIMGNEAVATGRLGVAQLRDSTSAGLAQLGVDTEEVGALSLSELAQIENVLGSDDDDTIKRGRIEQILTQ
jgi:hypothetical protein